MDEKLLEKYEIEQLIGNGTFGAVFRAREILCNRIVAIKALHKDIYEQGAMEYLKAEIGAMAKIWGHPNIVSIHTVEQPGGNNEYAAYIVMEYVDGQNLRKLINSGSIGLETALRIMLDICNGLAYAHQQNIIHRDVKPQNILLTQDLTAKVTDFSVARILERSNDYAKTVTGTRKYMAPEQYAGNYDHHVDIYAAGLIFFEMITGRFPFQGDTNLEMEYQKCTTDPIIPDNLPEDVNLVLQRALQRNPYHRYQTTTEMYEALDRIRCDLYENHVLEMMKKQMDAGVLQTTLAVKRDALKLSRPTAEMLEWKVAHRLTTERQTDKVQQTMGYYSSARRYLTEKRSSLAILELQRLIKLNLADAKTVELIEDLFSRLTDHQQGTKQEPGYEQLIDWIKELPPRDFSRLRSYINGVTVRQESGTQTSLNQAFDEKSHYRLIQSYLRANEYEKIAELFRKAAEEFERVGQHRKAKSCYKKEGGVYSKYAQILLKKGFSEAVPATNIKAAKAYREAEKNRKARRKFCRAAVEYSQLAEEADEEQNWWQAGEYYLKAAEAAKSAGKKKEMEMLLRRAVTVYYNSADSCYKQGNMENAYKCCQDAVRVARQIRGICTAADKSRQLLRLIEEELEAQNPPASPEESQ